MLSNLTNCFKNVVAAPNRLMGASTIAVRPYASFVERQVEKRKCIEGHATTSIPDYVGWSEKLASFSEVAVKADQAHERSFSALQQDTMAYLKADNHEPNITAGAGLLTFASVSAEGHEEPYLDHSNPQFGVFSVASNSEDIHTVGCE